MRDQFGRGYWEVSRVSSRCVFVRDMDDERIGRWSSLDLKDALDGAGVGRVGAESVNRLGWERENTTRAENFDRSIDDLAHGAAISCSISQAFVASESLQIRNTS